MLGRIQSRKTSLALGGVQPLLEPQNSAVDTPSAARVTKGSRTPSVRGVGVLESADLHTKPPCFLAHGRCWKNSRNLPDCLLRVLWFGVRDLK